MMTKKRNANCKPKVGCLVFEESPEAKSVNHDPSPINDPVPVPVLLVPVPIPVPVSVPDPVLVLESEPEPAEPPVAPMLLVELSVDDF